jgi:PHD/YefM family antitoxin component YafN of YafNO toxin-antitoxin module
MRVGITRQQNGLEKHHAGVPNLRRAAQGGQYHSPDHGLDEKQQKGADKQRDGIKRQGQGTTLQQLDHQSEALAKIIEKNPSLALQACQGNCKSSYELTAGVPVCNSPSGFRSIPLSNIMKQGGTNPMNVETILSDPGRIDEPRAIQEYSDVLSQVAAEGKAVIVCRNGEDVAAVIPLEYWELVREVLAQKEVQKLAAQIDWDRARKMLRPSKDWFDGEEPKPF